MALDYVQILMAFLGSVGFALFMKMKGRQVAFAAVGGCATWTLYLILIELSATVFIAALISSIFVGFYAEIMARVNKAPATIFLTAGAVTMVPGGNLYYTMLGVVTRDEMMFETNGVMAVTIALAISLGFIIVAILNKNYSRIVDVRRRKGERVPKGINR